MSRTLATFLFATPSTLSGVARMLDFWGLYDTYNMSKTPPEADAKALYADWRTVGDNLWESYKYIVALEEEERRERRVEATATV